MRCGSGCDNVIVNPGLHIVRRFCKKWALRLPIVLRSTSRAFSKSVVRASVFALPCGLAYVLEFADEVAANDEVFIDNDVTVIIDKKSLVYLEGTELDFTREGLNEGFKFNNPNVKDECGCGESFTI